MWIKIKINGYLKAMSLKEWIIICFCSIGIFPGAFFILGLCVSPLVIKEDTWGRWLKVEIVLFVCMIIPWIIFVLVLKVIFCLA